jgi:hypothetical protein
MVERVPLHNGMTPALFLGGWIDLLILLLLVILVALRWQKR